MRELDAVVQLPFLVTLENQFHNRSSLLGRKMSQSRSKCYKIELMEIINILITKSLNQISKANSFNSATGAVNKITNPNFFTSPW